MCFVAARQGIDVVHDLDNAYVEMLKVSNDALSSLQQYKLESFSRADEVGTTGEKLMNSTADWMRIGESLEKAAASAKTTNKLLNVSEFTDVNEATKAMVSMSQAYDTLSKDDIVDKLNNVGNNFSISTQGLAEGLQRSASALKTAGNDMDDAIALMTAGNAVVQDPTSVGAGLRTIALRLTGTKEGAQSLQDSGEDIDGMITTVSKLRDTIKSATAVASNGFKGFDILDKNGNYKSTYEILLGISQVYKEIIETDAKTGSNNKNLLLETISGKNRANIAASILENPSLLEKAYKSSKYDSKDSAQQELDRYLDSIDGRLTKLQNHADKFWNAFLNTGSVKNGISLIDGFVDRVTTLVSKFGALPTILGSMGAALTLQDVGRAKGCPSEYAYIV